jgi:hypothetical protein
MNNSEEVSKPNEHFLSADEIRETVATMYTKCSETVQERGHELLGILAKELKNNFPLADVEASPFWHAMTMSGEKKSHYIPNADNLQSINNRIRQFILEKLRPLIAPETESPVSDLLESVRDIKTKIFNSGDRSIEELYLREVTELVMGIQKECTFSVTKIPEIDAVIGGSGNPETSQTLNQEEVEAVTKKFKMLYEPIHAKFLTYLAHLVDSSELSKIVTKSNLSVNRKVGLFKEFSVNRVYLRCINILPSVT